jgi:hypothetical protein
VAVTSAAIQTRLKEYVLDEAYWAGLLADVDTGMVLSPNRYDGMDLADDACHMMLMSGLPTACHLQDTCRREPRLGDLTPPTISPPPPTRHKCAPMPATPRPTSPSHRWNTPVYQVLRNMTDRSPQANCPTHSQQSC